MGGSEPLETAPPATMARALAGLYLAGATIGALTVLLPHPVAADETVLWSNIALALAAAVALLLVATSSWVKAWICQVAVAIGTLVITRAVMHGGDADFYSLWYLWVGLYTFFFFGRYWGALHMALVGAAYGYALVVEPNSSPLAGWVMTVGTIAIAGVLIDLLAGRVRGQAEESDSRARALAAVSKVAHELARRTSPESAAPAVCESAIQVTGAAEAVLWEPSSDGSVLVATAATDATVKGTRVPFVSPPSSVIAAFASGEARFVSEPTGADSLALARLTGSALYQPVSREATPIGVLAIHWEDSFESMPGEAAWTVELLAVEAAIAIERAETLTRLEHVARTDDLTGLPNRRAWDEHLKREVSRARRENAPLAVAVLDLDHFKRYNDRFGHQAGDRFLKEVAANWQRRVRDTDILARYGGEEFALALAGASLEEATPLLERLRSVTPGNERVSVGVVQWDGKESEAELLDRADRALYAAKRGGRDRVVAS